MNKKLISFLLVASLVWLSACGTASNSASSDSTNKENQEPIPWSMGTSSSGSSPYILGGAISNLINKNQTMIRLSPQVTGGYDENFSLISSDSVQIAQANLPLINAAYAGEDNYVGNARKDIRALFNVDLMPIQVAVLENSDIKSGEDLIEKRVNIGPPKAATYDMSLKYFDALGLTESDIIPGSLTTKDAPGALRDNQQDVIFMVAAAPLPGLVEVSISKPIRLLAIEGKVAEDFIKNANNSLIPTKVSKDAYKGLSEDVNTVAAPITLYVKDDAPEKEVYEFTKTFWENLEQYYDDYPSGKSLTIDIAVQGIQVPLHPGAEKYFIEKGILK